MCQLKYSSMKLEKIIQFSFFIIFGYISGSLRQELMLKTEFKGINFDFIKSISYIDFLIGFIYPVFVFSFFIILFNISTKLFLEYKINELNEIVLFSMLPNFIFLSINLIYCFDLNIKDLEMINLSKEKSVIPFISYNTSAFLAEIFFLFPAITLFIYLLIKKYDLIKSFLVAILPILIIYLMQNII